jgi:type III pantothenate kinase
MLIAVDVGNTQTVIGVFAPVPGAAEPSDGTAGPPARAAGELADLRHHWRIATVSDRTPDELALMLTNLLALVGIELGSAAVQAEAGLAVSSSVPAVTAAFREMAHRWFRVPLVVIEPGVRTGMQILYDNPKEVGADRIANAVGAFDLYGGPSIVVDLGTATTFDVISAAGEYMGGAIAPGIEISLDALFAHAAALRRIELVEPRHVIGKSTVESIQSGVIYGSVAMVDGLCRRIAEELGEPAVIATGGLAALVAQLSKTIQHHEPWLTLHGLRIVYERNVDRADHVTAGTRARGEGRGEEPSR